VVDVSAASVTLSGGLSLAQVSEAIGALSWDYGTGKVSQVSFPAVDADRQLSKRGLLRAGTTLTHGGHRWEVAAVERDYRGRDVWLTFEARSRLARRLRLMAGPDKASGVTPGQWITSRAKKAGGVALVEPGAKRRTIVQKRTQSVLEVISALASDTGVEWVEFDNQVFVGTPWWAFQGRTRLPTWGTFATGADPTGVVELPLTTVGFTSRESLDDRGNAAEATLTVDPGMGRRVRPWHRVDVRRCDQPDDGMWLVTNVSFDESSDVTLALSRPLKSSPKKGSTGTGSSGGDAGLSPVEGSSYSDAPRPAGWRGRSVANIVEIFRNNPGGLGHTIYNGCLWYAQEMAGYAHENGQQANPMSLWSTGLAPSRKHASRSVVPGAVMLYSNSRIGHAVVYMGGGLCLSTDMDSQGNYSPGKWAIAGAEKMERSFGVTLMGWYSP